MRRGLCEVGEHRPLGTDRHRRLAVALAVNTSRGIKIYNYAVVQFSGNRATRRKTSHVHLADSVAMLFIIVRALFLDCTKNIILRSVSCRTVFELSRSMTFSEYGVNAKCSNQIVDQRSGWRQTRTNCFCHIVRSYWLIYVVNYSWKISIGVTLAFDTRQLIGSVRSLKRHPWISSVNSNWATKTENTFISETMNGRLKFHRQ